MKVIQLVVFPDTEVSGGAFLALGDDGSIWDWCNETRHIEGTRNTETRKIWKEIPGPFSVHSVAIKSQDLRPPPCGQKETLP